MEKIATQNLKFSKNRLFIIKEQFMKTMTRIITIITIALLFASCKKENINTIVGDWKIDNYTEYTFNPNGGKIKEVKHNFDHIKYVRFANGHIDIVAKDSTYSHAYDYYVQDGVLYTKENSNGDLPIVFESESTYILEDGIFKVNKPYYVMRRRQ